MERTPEAYTRGILAATLDPWIAGLGKAGAAYQSDKRLRARIDDPSLEATDKLSLLEGVLPQGTPPEVRNFLGVLLANDDFALVDDVLAALGRFLSEEAAGPKLAAITSAVPLDEEARERVRSRLVQMFGANLEYSFTVEPDILGGLIIRVGDKLVDDSVRGRLNALRTSLGVSSH